MMMMITDHNDDDDDNNDDDDIGDDGNGDDVEDDDDDDISVKDPFKCCCMRKTLRLLFAGTAGQAQNVSKVDGERETCLEAILGQIPTSWGPY